MSVVSCVLQTDRVLANVLRKSRAVKKPRKTVRTPSFLSLQKRGKLLTLCTGYRLSSVSTLPCLGSNHGSVSIREGEGVTGTVVVSALIRVPP